MWFDLSMEYERYPKGILEALEELRGLGTPGTVGDIRGR